LGELQASEVVEVVDGGVSWRFERSFLLSNWTCLWGRGCVGILDRPAPELGQGCCSVGAELDGDDEANLVSALAATLDHGRFEYHAAAADGGVFADETRRATRVVDGACIFLNRPGYRGGAGCALHLAALDMGDSPVGLKPSVCWQLPVRVDWEEQSDGSEVATVRRWSRADWGDEGETMAWCCTEGPEAYVGDSLVVDSLGEVLEEIAGPAVYAELRRRVDPKESARS
jgi:hypothetical protein